MRWYYFLLIAAVLLDLAILPWLFGVSWLPQLVLAILPFGFLFLPERDLKIIFALILIYLRSTSGLNLGILFLALILFLFYERWFLINFFHRSAWQTLAFSGLGVIIFYLTATGLSWRLVPAELLVSLGLIVSILLTTVAGASISFLLNRFYS